MITINTDHITLVNSERGPSGPAEPRLSISDTPDDDGYVEVTFKFKIFKDDRLSLSVSKGIGDEKEVVGFGQGSTYQERPDKVIDKANEWQKKEEQKSKQKVANILRLPESFFIGN